MTDFNLHWREYPTFHCRYCLPFLLAHKFFSSISHGAHATYLLYASLFLFYDLGISKSLHTLEIHKLNIVTFCFFNFCTTVTWGRNMYFKHGWLDCLNISSHETLNKPIFSWNGFFIADFIFMFHVNQSHLHSSFIYIFGILFWFFSFKRF